MARSLQDYRLTEWVPAPEELASHQALLEKKRIIYTLKYQEKLGWALVIKARTLRQNGEEHISPILEKGTHDRISLHRKDPQDFPNS